MPTIEDVLAAKGPDVVVASSDTTVREAASMMSQANVGSVIIKDFDDTKGIFTERDLLQRVIASGKDPAATRIDEVMSSPVKSCGLSDTTGEVIGLLTTEHIRHLAVIEQGVLIGLIGLRDVLAGELSAKNSEIAELKTRVGELV